MATSSQSSGARPLGWTVRLDVRANGNIEAAGVAAALDALADAGAAGDFDLRARCWSVTLSVAAEHVTDALAALAAAAALVDVAAAAHQLQGQVVEASASPYTTDREL